MNKIKPSSVLVGWQTRNNSRNIIVSISLIFLATLFWSIAWGPCAAPWNTDCFTNGDWGDYKHHYQGWISYLRGDYWLPPYQKAFTWPYLGSALTTDSIPIVALIAKPLTILFGIGNWQYFSLLSLFNLYLIIYASWRIARYRSLPRFGYVTLSILLITTSISWTRLRFGHESLHLHGLLILSLAWIICHNRSVTQWLLLLLFGIGVHAYYSPMLLAAFVVARIQSHRAHSLSWINTLFVGTLFTAICSLFFGYLPGYETASDQQVWSANLLSLLDPQQYSSIFPGIEVNMPYQVEGYSYLGIGILISVLFVIAYRGSGASTASSRGTLFPGVWWFVAGSLAILALGPKWWLADLDLYPNTSLCTIPGYCLFYDVFRSSGRFIWPLAYTVIIYVVDLVSRLHSPNLVLGIILFLQLADSNLRSIYKQGYQYKERYVGDHKPHREWIRENPRHTDAIRSADLLLVRHNAAPLNLPPPYTPQYINNKIRSNWGGEGMTRWPRQFIPSKVVDMTLEVLHNKNITDPSLRLTGSNIILCDTRASTLRSLQKLSQLQTIKLSSLGPGWYRIHVK